MKRELRILFLEDSHLDVEIIEQHLRSGKIAFSCKRVETEASFRVALREFLPDVILLDNQLPAYSGTEGLKLARKLCPNVPVIFISGTIGEERAVEWATRQPTNYRAGLLVIEG